MGTLRRFAGLWVIVALMAGLFNTGNAASVQAQTVCVGAVDIMLVLDGSSSIYPSDFEIMRSFSKSVVGSFTVDDQNAHFGVVQFSTTAQQEIGLTGDASAIDNALDGMQQIYALTDIAAGLSLAQDELNTNGRSGVAHAIILLTDGISDANEAIAAAQDAKDSGSIILTIGVGSGIDFDLLTSVASNPSYVFTTNDFSDLQQILASLVSTTCQGTGVVAQNPESVKGDPAFVTVAQAANPNITARPNSTIVYSIAVTNRGKGSAKNTIITMPFDSAKVRLLDATFSRQGVWVSQLGDTSVELQTGVLGSGGDTVTATLRLSVQAGAADGAALSERLTYRWSDSRSGGSGASNIMLVKVGSSDDNQPYYPLEVSQNSGPAGTVFAFGSNLLVPNEPISFWYNTPSGTVEGLNTLRADGDGVLVGEFDSTGLEPGSYSMVAHGSWSNQTFTVPFTVE